MADNLTVEDSSLIFCSFQQLLASFFFPVFMLIILCDVAPFNCTEGYMLFYCGAESTFMP